VKSWWGRSLEVRVGYGECRRVGSAREEHGWCLRAPEKQH